MSRRKILPMRTRGLAGPRFSTYKGWSRLVKSVGNAWGAGGPLFDQTLRMIAGWTGLENCGNLLTETLDNATTGGNLYGYISQAIGETSLDSIGGLFMYSHSVDISANRLVLSFGLSGNEQIPAVNTITINYQQGEQGVVVTWDAPSFTYRVEGAGVPTNVTNYFVNSVDQRIGFDIVSPTAQNVTNLGEQVTFNGENVVFTS